MHGVQARYELKVQAIRSKGQQAQREAALNAVSSYLAERDPGRAIGLVMARSQARERHQLAATLAREWASIDIQAA